MWLCAQIDRAGVCRVLAHLKGPAPGDHIVPLNAIDDRIMGRRYLAGAWVALTVSAPKTTIAVGELLPVTVAWLDLAGALVDVPDQVTASSEADSVGVPMVGGTGELDFQAADVGTYAIKIRAACGVETNLVVTVS